MKKYLLSLATGLLIIGLAIATGYANGVSYTYDQLNRLVRIVNPDGTIITYEYDDVGNRVIQNVIQTPKANFTASPASGTAPLSVSFTDKSVGIVSSWSWSFGDGGSSTSQSPAYTYGSAGTYTVILTVSNSFGSSSYQATITVIPPAPVANFSASPTSGAVPLSVQFTDASTGSVTSWSWTFGDGGTSTSQNPSHTYTNPGTYTATLTASGPGGNSNPQTTSITVIPPPVANFSATPTSGTAPLQVQFADASTGSVTSWSWVFGDGGTSTSQNPSHIYSAPGTYTVSLTVSGPGGSNTDTQNGYITVSASTYGIDQYTKLMLHFDGPNGSRTFTDSEQIPKTVTGYGNAQISTAYSEFGGSSLALDGSSYLSAPASSNWNFRGILPSISGGTSSGGYQPDRIQGQVIRYPLGNRPGQYTCGCHPTDRLGILQTRSRSGLRAARDSTISLLFGPEAPITLSKTVF